MHTSFRFFVAASALVLQLALGVGATRAADGSITGKVETAGGDPAPGAQLHGRGRRTDDLETPVGAIVNTDLDSTGYSFSARKRSGRLTGGLTLFRNEIEKYIYDRDTGLVDTGSGLPIFQSVQNDARFQGAEVDLHEDGTRNIGEPKEPEAEEPLEPETEPPPPPPPPLWVQTAGGRGYVNLSLDVLAALGASTEPDVTSLQLGGHDPTQRGFTIQNVEIVVEGAVDPYLRGQANVILFIDPEGETVVELEEAYATTTSLPANLQVKAGQFFTEFGRLNPQHPHSWDFVDQPLANGRFFGGDGLRSAGARLSWLTPAPFYSELFLTAQNGRGETLTSFGSVAEETRFGRPIVGSEVAALRDLLYVPRYAASADLTDTQTLLAGASAAFGPNGTGPEGRTHVYGVDLFYKWKPSRAEKGFPFVKVQAEAMRRAYRAAATASAPLATFRDTGGYVQALWGFRTRWVLGGRYERVYGARGDAAADDPLHEPRWRASANLTWFPTEYSKLRLQYNHDAREVSRDAGSLWLQLEFLLGAHAAHKF